MPQLADRTTEDSPSRPPRAPARHSGSPALGVAEIALLVLAALALAIVMTWPLVLELDRRVAQDLGDPIRTAWQVAWEGHALLTRPFELFQSNAFWPLADSLAFSDSLLGYAPAGFLGEGAVAALVRYNGLFLAAQALAFAGAYLLARELGAGRAGAAVAGAAFAYAPFRLAMNGHLHVISSGGIPLALFFLLRGYRGARPGLVLGGWLVAAWQLSLGFTLGLQLVYLLAALGVVAAVGWTLRGRRSLPPRLVAATVAGAVALLALGAYQARPYLEVTERYAGAERSESLVSLFSPQARSFLAAPPESRLWGGPTAGVRTTLPMPGEQALFPGLAILALAVTGALAGSVMSRRLRNGLVLGTAASAALSLGFGVADGYLGYRLLFEYAPGWGAVRTPGRIATLTSLGLALLAAAGAAMLVGRIAMAARSRPSVAKVAGPAAAALLVAAVLADGAGRLPQPSVPPVPPERMAQPAPVLHAPSDNNFDRLYMLWSTERFAPIVNGTSTFARRQLLRGRRALRGFPDRRSVALLRAMGVRTVVLHLDVEGVRFPPPGNEPLRAEPARLVARRPIRGLGLERERLPGAIAYHLSPAGARLGSPDS
jgi:hypothetical protein